MHYAGLGRQPVVSPMGPSSRFGSGRCWVGLCACLFGQVIPGNAGQAYLPPPMSTVQVASPLMSLHQRGGDDGESSLRGQTQYRASRATKQGCPLPPFLVVCLPLPPAPPSSSITLLLEHIRLQANRQLNDKMADENTNPAVEETKVDETPISHPNAARRNSLEKQLAHRPDRAELVESKHEPSRICPA